ncbi:ribonuclease 1-like [Cicer arietinum]
MPCKPNVPIKFTLHGLWPSNHSGFEPSFCSQTKLNTGLIVGDLKTRLIAEWPNLNGVDDHFWSYEWDKHGTCSSMPHNPLGYLSLALTIKNKHEILPIFARANIVPHPNKTYTRSLINSTIFGAIHVIPQLSCVFDAKRNSYLLEIRLCLDQTGATFINCNPYNNCGNNIILPL